MDRKIKVVWICSFSNRQVRESISVNVPNWYKILRWIQKRGAYSISDYAVWNSNAIIEFEKLTDIDLYVIFTHPMLRGMMQDFSINGIKYYAINSGDNKISAFVKNHIYKDGRGYKKTWDSINSVVKSIQPDIIHLIGAENPDYSMSVLQVSGIPVITQLQTLLNDPEKELSKAQQNQLLCEKKVLQKTDYIGTKSTETPAIIRRQIKGDAVFVNTRLIVAEKADFSNSDKEYDFVYFSNTINKAIDLVLEAFAIAYKKNPSLTLDIIGGYTNEYYQQIKSRMSELGITNAIKYEGSLPTHDDVIRQIKKSRFAILPLKIDLISSTIREAIWAGLPVLTTITKGTPVLNEKRDSVLLSEIGDHEMLAANMLKIVNDQSLADLLRQNAVITVEELYGDNAGIAKEWIEMYKACINNYNNGTTIPDMVLNKN